MPFGTGKNYRVLAAHDIAKAHGEEKAAALPVFHAITWSWCDTTSLFAGREKKTAWAVWDSYPDVTEVFLKLVYCPSEVPKGHLTILERFVVLLYDRTCSLDKVRF